MTPPQNVAQILGQEQKGRDNNPDLNETIRPPLRCGQPAIHGKSRGLHPSSVAPQAPGGRHAGIQHGAASEQEQACRRREPNPVPSLLAWGTIQSLLPAVRWPWFTCPASADCTSADRTSPIAPAGSSTTSNQRL